MNSAQQLLTYEEFPFAAHPPAPNIPLDPSCNPSYRANMQGPLFFGRPSPPFFMYTFLTLNYQVGGVVSWLLRDNTLPREDLSIFTSTALRKRPPLTPF